jgi:hypothetical protein
LITLVINVHLVRLDGAPGYRKRFRTYRRFAKVDVGWLFDRSGYQPPPQPPGYPELS